MGHRSHRAATASALAAGGVGLATVLLAGPAEATHPVEPGGSRTAAPAPAPPPAPAPAPIVVEADQGIQVGQVGAGALGGLLVAAATGIALNRRHHGASDSADVARTV